MRNLASYASRSEQSRGRLYNEGSSDSRSVFQRDRDRIVHSSAFRRLQYKTQVFLYHVGDHYRTRLTHSLEVAQISRSIARNLNLDEDLAEAIALAHDLGHTPFGHAGEAALNSVISKSEGFDHNAQSFAVLTELECRYAEFNGLNLSWETLEGVLKHNGPLSDETLSKSPHMQKTVRLYTEKQDLEVNSFAGAEAQIAAISDDIAYNVHDIEDGLRAGLITIDDIRQLPFIDAHIEEITKKFGQLEFHRLRHELSRRLVSEWVYNVCDQSKQNLEAFAGMAVEDIRRADAAVIEFDAQVKANIKQLREFLFEKVYYHPQLRSATQKSKKIITDLYCFFAEDPICLPKEWQVKLNEDKQLTEVRNIANYIAGMTDRFAMEEYKKMMLV